MASTGLKMSSRNSSPFLLVACLCLCFLNISSSYASPEKVRIQLKWYHQFQFAGYYAAQLKGFYQEEGLDAELIEGAKDRSPDKIVLEGKAEFGVHDGGDLLYRRLKGDPLVALATIFQHSPYIIASKKQDGIRHPADLVGRTVLITQDQGSASILAMFRREGIKVTSTFDKEPVRFAPHSWDFEDVLAGRADAMSAYLTEIPRIARQYGVVPSVLNPLDYGVDFYGDTLFASEAYLKAKPDVVARFRRASLKGWLYAMAHPREIVDVILTFPSLRQPRPDRQALLDEAESMNNIILPTLVDMGNMNPGRWELMAKIYQDFGMISSLSPLSGFTYEIDAEKQQTRKYLQVVGIALACITLLSLLGLFWLSQLKKQVNFRTRLLSNEITERKLAEEKIIHLAYFDQLTDLPNRTLLQDRLKQAMANSQRSGRHAALLLLDLDYFKTLNDTLGHEMGDLLLKQVAQRLVECVREEDTVARFGGDEFVVMLVNLSESQSEAASLVELIGGKIIAALNQTYELKDVSYRISSSIGACVFLGHQSDSDSLLKQADLAMYKAKEQGRNTLRFFDPDMAHNVLKRAILDNELREALEKRQFVLLYQAQITGSQVTGAEVLLRWQHPERGLVSPAEFIPAIEETGLILPVGQWVLETACQRLADWAVQPAMSHLTLAVNISAHQINHEDFVDQVLKALELSGACPDRLKLELTESLLVNNVEKIISKMNTLKAKGVGFSLDDFGTGYSSLSYLKRLPLDQLKIDQSFVRDILTDANDAAIARMIVVLAENLGLAVIAEGVETEAQRNSLTQQGCHAYQGYLFSRPLLVDDFESFVKRG